MGITKADFDEVVAIIKQSKLFNNFCYKCHWISGSSTVVFPIQVWYERQEVELQLNNNYRGRTQCIDALIRRISKDFPVKKWYIRKSDGSCPSTLNIYFK